MKLRITGKLMTAGIAAIGLLLAGAGAASASTPPVKALRIISSRTSSLQMLSKPQFVTLPGAAHAKRVSLPAALSGGKLAAAATVYAYEIINDNSGKCAEVYHSETTNYANVDQYSCNGSATQYWIFVEVATSGGYPVYELVNDNSGLCAEVYHSETTNTANVDQYGCNGTNTQLWVAEGSVFVNYNSGKVMEVYHSETTDYANVDQYTYNGTATQLWTY